MAVDNVIKEIKPIKTNYHTHSTWCDGKYSTEEVVLDAIKKNFTHLGFSSHAMFPFSTEYHLSAKHFHEYVSEIQELQEKYAEKIDILIGFEAEFMPPLTKPDYSFYKQFSPDYLIGSVHYLFNPRREPLKSAAGDQEFFFAVDHTPEILRNGIQKVFNGNAKKAVQTYFYLQREMMKQGDFEIVGHIDLIKKRNNQIAFYDENAGWYQRELLATAKEAKKQNKVVEINTSALARKLHPEVYPSTCFIKHLVALDVPLMMNSDMHRLEFFDAEFSNTKELLKNVGVKELHYITKSGWKRQPL